MDEKETSFYTTVLIISVVLGVIITYFIFSIVRQHRRSLALYRKSIQTEIQTLETERTRLAADLHDEVGPVLSALKLKLNSLDIQDPDDQEEVIRTNKQIDNLMKRMREITFDLMPNTLIRKGLPAAVLEFIEYCGKSSSLKIDFKYEQVKLSQKQAINLYRILQEIVHNSIKHSGASELSIELSRQNNGILLITKDNGVGFNYDLRSKEASGLGLRNLLSRTEIINGKMFIESQKTKGTTYTFEIPTDDETNRAH